MVHIHECGTCRVCRGLFLPQTAIPFSTDPALRRHAWTIRLMKSRSTPGTTTPHHHDAVLACLRAAGLPVELTAHAYTLLDSHTYGFAVQEAALPFEATKTAGAVGDAIVGHFPDGAYPHLVENGGRTHHETRIQLRQ